MKISVTKVQGLAAWQDFLAVPYGIYGDEKLMPPQANRFNTSARFMPLFNPVLAHVVYANFVAYSNRQVVGRITAAVDNLNLRREEGFWGCFESVNKVEVAGVLLDAAAQWLKEQNKTIMVGPATLNTNQQVGVLIEGFDRAMQHELPYNPTYYQCLMEQTGLTKVQDLECYRWRLPKTMPASLSLKGGLANVTLRPVAPGLKDAAIIRDIYNQTFKDMWGFIPLTKADAAGILMGVGYNIPPELFLIIEVDGQPVAMFLSIPYKKPGPDGRGGKIRLAVGGVVPEFRQKGLSQQVLGAFYQLCYQLGYKEGEASQIAESNTAIKKLIMKPFFQGQLIKRYRVYQRLLS